MRSHVAHNIDKYGNQTFGIITQIYMIFHFDKSSNDFELHIQNSQMATSITLVVLPAIFTVTNAPTDDFLLLLLISLK
jgi:hypothetical protein